MALVGKLLLPVAGLAAVTMTASGVNSAAGQLVNDRSRADLFKANGEALLKLGFDPNLVKQVLSLPYYSPREATYLRFYLEKLKDISGSHKILKTAASSQSLWEARKILYEAEMAAHALNDNKIKFIRLDCLKEGLAVETFNQIILMTPYDYLDRSELGGRVIEQSMKVKRERSKGAVEIWNAGKITSGFSLTALALEAQTRPWFLFSA